MRRVIKIAGADAPLALQMRSTVDQDMLLPMSNLIALGQTVLGVRNTVV